MRQLSPSSCPPAVPQLSPSSCSWESAFSLFAQFLATGAFSEGGHKPAVTHRRENRKVGSAGRCLRHRRHSVGGFWRVLHFLHSSLLAGPIPITLALSQSSLVGLQGLKTRQLSKTALNINTDPLGTVFQKPISMNGISGQVWVRDAVATHVAYGSGTARRTEAGLKITIWTWNMYHSNSWWLRPHRI